MMQQTIRHRQTGQPGEPEWVHRIATTIAAAVTAQVRQTLTSPPEGSPYMSVQEAAEYMRCKPQRVYDLLAEHHLRRHKDGARVLVRRDQIDMYLNALEHTRSGARQALRAVPAT